MAAIEFNNVSFSYEGASLVLNDVNFSVEEGEFVAIIGNNGSGKSTIAKLLDAFYAPSKGSVYVLGHDVGELVNSGQMHKLRQDVGFVFQNPDDQIVATLVIDEVAFGPENLGVDPSEIASRVENALDAVDMLDCLAANVNALSGGQRQRVAIADALAMQPKLLILDEPTSMLDAQGKQDVMNIVKKLNARGITIVWITHSAEEVFCADRVIEVAGKSVREATASEYEGMSDFTDHTFASDRLVVTDTHDANTQESAASCNESGGMTHADKGAPVIKIEELCYTYGENDGLNLDLLSSMGVSKPVLKNVNLDVFEGELLAICGPNGSGKSTLIQHMNGLLKPTSGNVRVYGMNTSTKEGANHARKNVGISFQYPERSLFAQSVFDEIAYGLRNIGAPECEIEMRVKDAMYALELDYDKFASRNPFELSGGEQRKVALAGVFVMRPKVLVLDEPCASLDAPTHRHFVRLISEMKAAGQTIVLVTHDQRDVDLLADRVFWLERDPSLCSG